MAGKKKFPSKSKYAGMSRTERARAIGRLGGLARAAKLTPEQRSRISAKGGMVTYMRHGTEHFSEMGTNSWEAKSEEAKAEKMKNMWDKKKQSDVVRKEDSGTVTPRMPTVNARAKKP